MPAEAGPALALSGLLEALREAGLAVGIADELRLAEVFRRAPRVHGDDQLASLLRAVLVKNADDRERFDRVLAGWLERADGAARRAERMHRPSPGPGPSPPGPESVLTSDAVPPPPPRSRLAVTAAAVAVLVAVVIAGYKLDDCLGTELPDAAVSADAGMFDAGPDAGPTPLDAGIRPSACAPTALRGKTFTAPVPVLTIADVPPAPALAWPLALAAVGLGAAALLWFGLRRRHMLAPREPLPAGATLVRVDLAPPAGEIPSLLDPRAREAMVWGIDRFVSEQTTRRLDVPATIRDIARRGGLPRLHFQRARFHREVWLWVDELAEDRAVARLADEIEAALRAAGLPVERAEFRGIPDRLVDAGGHAFMPRDVEARRHGTAVAVLTDGAVLADCYRDHQRRIDSLLRDLAHWPRLALVDFSDAASTARSEPDADTGAGSGVDAPTGTLAVLARTHQIDVVAPAALADTLGAGGRRQRRQRSSRRAPEHARWSPAPWAAACALCPAPVHESTARALHRWLGLSVPVWALAGIGRAGSSPQAHLAWPEAQRLSYLRWLRESQAQREVGPVEGSRTEDDARPSLLARALDFWTARYQAEGKRHPPDSDEGRQLALEQALIALWRDPEPAAEILNQLCQGRFEAVIAGHLGALVPADAGDDPSPERLRGPAGERVRTLWRSEDFPRAYVMLRAMGLDPGAPAVRLRRPGRLWMGVSACAGAALGVSVTLALALTKPPPPCQVPMLARDNAWATAHLDDDDRCQVTVATAQTQAVIDTAPGAGVAVDWQEREHACVQDLTGGTLWRCGAEDRAPPASTAQARRVVIVDAAANETTGPWHPRDLAVALLDCDQADAVYLGSAEAWASDRGDVFGASSENEATRVITAAGWQDELHRLHGRDGDRPGCGSGVMMAEIPGGTFWMGTREEDGDSMAEDDELPHQVTVGGFSIGVCEVTNRQYRAFLDAARPQDTQKPASPAYWGNPSRNQPGQPVVGVSWDEAKAFCEHYGFELPTEAEWEYACRGPEPNAPKNRPWPFEGGQEALQRYAWYNDNSQGIAHPAGTKDPLGYGLHDMLGNVWEWNADWYGAYGPATESPLINPSGSEEGSGRVLRGGSFFNWARNSRCANRFRNGPENRFRDYGFRCVRGSGRQP